MENVKMPMVAGMLCTIDGKTFHMSTNKTWIGDSCTSCHITKNETSLLEITNTNKFVQRSSGSMSATKKGQLHVNVHKVNGIEEVHILWPIKWCPKTGTNLFFLTCKLLQGNTIICDHKNNILRPLLKAVSS